MYAFGRKSPGPNTDLCRLRMTDKRMECNDIMLGNGTLASVHRVSHEVYWLQQLTTGHWIPPCLGGTGLMKWSIPYTVALPFYYDIIKQDQVWPSSTDCRCSQDTATTVPMTVTVDCTIITNCTCSYNKGCTTTYRTNCIDKQAKPKVAEDRLYRFWLLSFSAAMLPVAVLALLLSQTVKK